ncbi:MAG: vWA domain-containing protein [Sciscionella sp.]
MAELAVLTARFGAALRAAGLPTAPGQCLRFARAVTVAQPSTLRELRHVGLATLTGDPTQRPAFDAVFDTVFGGVVDPAQQRGEQNGEPIEQPQALASPRQGSAGGSVTADVSGRAEGHARREVATPAAASDMERLRGKDFAELSAAELALLAGVMRRFALITPQRRARRMRSSPRGSMVDIRASLRQAHRTGGYPLRLSLRTPKTRRRKLVVLCDISGSMEPYSRAMLQLLYCAAGGAGAEVFTFATRLTRLTRELARRRPADALARACAAAPDWAGGTKIAEAVAAFTDRYGHRGVARGAVVLIVSDGWETGEPLELGRQLARLSRLAYRIVWANPRTASSRYRPLVGGMAAAWRYCDAVVSAHNLESLDDLTTALATRR